MHRRPLLDLLDAYQKEAPEESIQIDQIRSLVVSQEKCFDRTCLPGHITASTWIVSHDLERVLLTHHRKLDAWLQLGGHADGETSVLDVALREAREESGMQHFRVIGQTEPAVPFDVDVHTIPARKNEPAHEHHDIRYLLVAEPGQSLVISDESLDLRWFHVGSLPSLSQDTSLLRMNAKAQPRLARLAGN